MTVVLSSLNDFVHGETLLNFIIITIHLYEGRSRNKVNCYVKLSKVNGQSCNSYTIKRDPLDISTQNIMNGSNVL